MGGQHTGQEGSVAPADVGDVAEPAEVEGVRQHRGSPREGAGGAFLQQAGHAQGAQQLHVPPPSPFSALLSREKASGVP